MKTCLSISKKLIGYWSHSCRMVRMVVADGLAPHRRQDICNHQMAQAGRHVLWVLQHNKNHLSRYKHCCYKDENYFKSHEHFYLIALSEIIHYWVVYVTTTFKPLCCWGQTPKQSADIQENGVDISWHCLFSSHRSLALFTRVIFCSVYTHRRQGVLHMCI